MITDKETNYLYLSDRLESDYPNFFKNFKKELNRQGIVPEFLRDTKDVWCNDFMPIQISEKKFVQFRYEPDYLREYPDRRISGNGIIKICEKIQKGNSGIANMKIVQSQLNIDGGNVVKAENKVIMCDKVFHENKHLSEKEIIKELEGLFQVDKLIFVPWDINDFTGHADGMVRFIDNDTVLINDYFEEEPEFQTSFRMSLHNAGLEYRELPCFIPDDPMGISARGLYLNYLQMEKAVFMPTFKLKSDDKAYRILSDIFIGQDIVTVESSDIARDGGIINCATWNIKK